MSTFNYNNADYFGFVESLKKFLANTPEFKDYNFEGSNISHLIELLAYNAHYQNAYMNFMLGESFLSSATRRNSILAISRQLGYTPHSYQSANTTIDILVSDFENSYPKNLVLPKYTPFTASNGERVFTFYNTEDIYSEPTYKDQKDANYCWFYENSNYNSQAFNAHKFSKVKIIEGSPVTNYFEVVDENKLIFTIMNKNIDTQTLRVYVYTDAGTMYNIINGNSLGQHIEYQNFVNYPNAENQFVCYEVDNEYFDLRFPKGSLRKGNAIRVEYNICNGSDANGITSISLANVKLFNAKYVNLTINEMTHSGSEKEDIESIRENTPIFYASQDRAIINDDFKALILNKFGFVERINVWGGEEMTPPEYSKVFISIVPNNTSRLTATQKTDIEHFISTKTNKRTRIKLVDADILNIALDVKCYYDSINSPKSANEIKQLIIDNLKQWNQKNLNQFKSKIIFSKLSTVIDTSYNYISSTNIKMKLFLDITVVDNLQSIYNLNLNNSLTNIKSSIFDVSYDDRQHYFANEGEIIKLYRINDDNTISTVINDFGSVDLEKGTIVFENTDIINTTNITLEVVPRNKDFTSYLQFIPTIDFTHLNIEVLPE